MRLLYVSRSAGVHDTRFVDAWRGCGLEVEALTSPVDDEGERTRFLDAVQRIRPDVVQVGPVTSPGPMVTALWDGPVIATSWAFDLLLEARESDKIHDEAAAVLRRADLIFVDSRAVHDEALSMGADASAIVTFPWGIAPEWLEGMPRPREASSAFVFLSTRRHESLYRVEDAVLAFLTVAAEHAHVQLWIAGSGSLTPHLRDVASRSPYGDRVHFLGERSGSALRELYETADVYLSSSIVDGTSISLLEAMASGALPVVSDIPGNREWISDDVGFSFAVGDLDQLASTMQAAVGLSIDVRAAMARAAFERVRKFADWERASAALAGHAELAISRHAAAVSGTGLATASGGGKDV